MKWVLIFLVLFTAAGFLYAESGCIDCNSFSVNDQILAVDGTASAPSYSFVDESNTGIYRSGAGTLLFADRGLLRWGMVGSQLKLKSDQRFDWTNGEVTDTGDTSLRREGAGILSVSNALSPSEFRTYNTNDGSGNTEYGTAGWVDTADVLAFGTKATGTGTQRPVELDSSELRLLIAGVSQWRMSGTSLFPTTNNTEDIGAPATRVKVVYTGDIDFSSEAIGAVSSSPTSPTYTFSGNTDTGMYRASGDELGFSHGGEGKIGIEGSEVRLKSNSTLGWSSGEITTAHDVALSRRTADIAGVDGGWQVDDGGTQPSCDSTVRGTYWYEAGGAGVKDVVEVCAKDAADAYAWRTIY